MPSPLLPASILDAWNSLGPQVKAALIASEMSSNSTQQTKSASSVSLTSGSSQSDFSGDKTEQEDEIVEYCQETGTKTVMRPVERAPENVFEITKTTSRESTHVEKTASSLVTTKTTIMTST